MKIMIKQTTERVIDSELLQMIKEESTAIKTEKHESATLMGKYLMEAEGNEDTNDDIELDFDTQNSESSTSDNSNKDDKFDNDSNDTDEDIELDFDTSDNSDESEQSKDTDPDDDNDDDNDEDIDFELDFEMGNDSNEQNEYDPKEIETLNALIADEQHAMQAYFDAGKTTKHVILSRLYSDIGREEAFHSEQLLYAKSEITGEKYEPSDPEVKKEYEELLANGMDEETAMVTIADKHSLSPNDDDDDDLEKDIEELENDVETVEEMCNQTFANCEMLLTILESDVYRNNYELRKAYDEFASNVIMEAVDNPLTKEGKTVLGTSNPLVIIINMIRTAYSAILTLVKKFKTFIDKHRIKSKRTIQWLKKHGIKGLFSNGMSLYFYDDTVGGVEVSDACGYLVLCMNVVIAVGSTCKMPFDAHYYEPKLNSLVIGGNTFANLASKKVVNFSSISNGADKIRSTVFTKSKLIINDENEAKFADMFFGLSGDLISRTTTDENGQSQRSFKSQNIHNMLEALMEGATYQLNALNKYMNDLQQNMSSTRNSMFYTHPEKFQECTEALKTVAKGYSKLIKCLSHDVSECMKLDQRLLNAVNDTDSSRITDSKHKKDIGKYTRLNVDATNYGVDKKGNNVIIPRTSHGWAH